MRVIKFAKLNMLAETSSHDYAPDMKSQRIPIALQQAIYSSLRRHLDLANVRLNSHFPEPEILFTQRGSSAGTAWLNENQIRLNPLLMIENQQAFIDEVVPHELAHLLTWRHFGRVAPHGKEWRWMMETVFGVCARRTHQFALDAVRPRTFPYQCRCQRHQLTVRRHNRILRGESQYRCRQCGERLKPAI